MLSTYTIHAATYPLDLTKTRLQIQGEAMTKAAAIAASSGNPHAQVTQTLNAIN